ncbi:TrbI/VirB10 family protein [Eoetvoesiella caeni]
MIIRDKWQTLDPKKKRWIIVGAGAGAILLAIGMFSGKGDKDSSHKPTRQDVIKNVLTDRDTRNVGLESLSADLKALRSESTKATRKLEKLERDLDVNKRKAEEVPPQFKNQLERMADEISKLKDAGKNPPNAAPGTQGEAADSSAPTTNTGVPGAPSGEPSAGASNAFTLNPRDPMAVFQNTKWKTTKLNTATPGKDSTAGAANPSSSASVKLTTYVEAEPAEEKQEAGEEDSLFLPAGSIITGSLINGMDAPTGNGARKDPFPSSLRIQKEAILPNRFRADVRECFLIVSGYGDLSSERAYLRGETISCVREDGGIIESKLDSYAVGEDGKAGVRGRLVSKQGQIIMKSLVAGFLGGVSKAFDVKPVPIIDTRATGNSNTQFQHNQPSTNWLQSSAVSGASSALDRIADFYLKMADGMFPVIEVDAGRQIDVIVSKGSKLQIRTKGKK